MKRRAVLLSAALALAAQLLAYDGYPRVLSVEPDTGKTGDVVSVKGENLDKSGLGELYLTDGSKDTKLQMSLQSEKEIQFKVPKVQANRYRLMILTADKKSMVEQPVVFTVE